MIQNHKRPFNLRELKIEVSYYCELNCIHCSSEAQPSNSLKMSRDDCMRILSEAKKIGAKEVAFSGGEPLSWPHIFDAVEKANASLLNVTIYTSGVVDDFKDKAQRLQKHGATRFIFSVFGSTTLTHERITRIAGSLNKTKNAIICANKIGLETEIHFVPMSNNYRELKDVVILGKQLGVKGVSVLRLVPQGRAMLIRGRVLNKVQNIELRCQIKKLREKGYKIRTGSPYNFLMLSDSPKCCAAIDRLVIGPDLKVYPCDAFKQVEAIELVGTQKYSTLNGIELRECWEKSPYLVL